MQASKQVILTRAPAGVPALKDFEVIEREVADPDAGQVQVQNLLMSVDPYMRPQLDNPAAVGAPLLGGGIGRVAASPSGKFREGDLVRHDAGFAERFNIAPRHLTLLRPDPELPLTVYLHALGATGLTAYGGLLEIGRPRAGESVFVSTAAGAVGSVCAQIAKLKGCYVVGSAGAPDKCDWLSDAAGLDAVINYKLQPIADALAATTPNGLDVYFDNVGGDHLDAALARLNRRGRIAVCGMISAYNGAPEPVFQLPRLIYGRMLLQGFVGSDFPHLAAAFNADMTAWLKDGRIQYQETILDGIERAPEGLIGLFRGRNRGKMLIRIAD